MTANISHLAQQICAGGQRTAFLFAGQAGEYLSELRREALAWPEVMDLVTRVEEALQEEAESPLARDSGLLEAPLQLRRWLESEEPPVDVGTLASSIVSQPLIFLTQATHIMAAGRVGFPQESWPHLCATAGHSQGLMTSVLLSSVAGGSKDFADEVVRICRYFFWQGLRMQQAFPDGAGNRRQLQAHYDRFDEGFPSPMGAIKGLSQEGLDEALAALDPAELSGPIVRSLVNGPDRLVVSGDPADLVQLRLHLADSPIHWEFLRTSAPFHSPYMAPALDMFRQDLHRLDISFSASDLSIPVLSTADGSNLQQVEDLTEALLRAQFLEPVNWVEVCRRIAEEHQAQTLIDWGPQTTVAHLVSENLEGLGVAVLAAEDSADRSVLFDPENPVQAPVRWADFAPRTVRLPDGTVRLANRFTEASGFHPLFGGGMTPTTTTTEIVTAAAKEGYIVEWAGGGQVTDKIFRQRLIEMCESLPEGSGILFNALYLDPYLWQLHKPLLLEMRAEGFPILGVTITGGIPPLEEATSVLTEFHRAGICLNSLKVGGDGDIKRALAIADALPDQTIIIQVEGGKAGGHHSGTPLESLLKKHYGRLRKRPNVLIAAGGGVASEEQVAALLYGTWAEGPAPRPVDAVFVGTVLMACAEAHTSPAVKRNLAKLSGGDALLSYGQKSGGIVSGRSGLDADIYYIENNAAAAALALEKMVKQSPDSLVERRDEVAALLERTCKPWFGPLEEMTYGAVLARMVELMAPGEIPSSLAPFGPWFDESYFDRFAAFCRRVLERFAADAIEQLDELSPDEPASWLEHVSQSAEAGVDAVLLDEDADYFLVLCRRPGKPVSFVPRIDAEVARWLTRDALWQAHDPRYPAESVFCVPGPAGVQGINQVDEPVAETLGRLLEGSMAPATATATSFAGAGRASTSDDPLALEPAAAPIQALLTAPFIGFDGQIKPNVLRGWTEEVDTLTWRKEKDRIVLEGRRNEVVAWQATGDGKCLRLAVPLGGRSGALKLFARFLPSAAAPLLFDPLEEPVTEAYAQVWNAGFVFDMDAFRALIRGDQGNAPPICAAFPMAWNSITRQLFQELPPLNYLNLLHLEQEFVRPRRVPNAVDQPPAAAIESLEEHPLGTTITVIAASQLGLWSRSKFLVRGASVPKLKNGKEVLEWPVDSIPDDPTDDIAITVDKQSFVAPRDAAAYARCSGDANPLHLSPEVAGLAGYDRPIMHGMWTLARALSLAVQYLGEAYGRLSVAKASFQAPVYPGDELEFELRRLGPARGGRWFQTIVRRDGIRVLQARVFVRPRRTAYVFTGQGSQFAGMGMELYARCDAAREVWDKAEEFLKRRYGYSILDVVRDNPTSLRFSGRQVSHPKGVLHLTQFTQVAITLVEMAQVEHLKAEGVYVERAMFAGHSLGEYAALSALDILSLEWMVDMVYRRGLTMQGFVERDRNGRSPFAMIVVRPHLAGLDEAGLTELVSSIASEGGLLEVVNFNVRDRQYAVAGDQTLLKSLRDRLDAATPAGNRSPYVKLPGIDVPFHSSQLRSGVAAFREVVRESIGDSIDPKLLVGRYVPNLVGRPFEFNRDFVEAAHDSSQSPALADILVNWKKAVAKPEKLAATLLVELLSYQFASPVRWVETQEHLLVTPEWRVDDLVELGPQPVLTGMAERSLKMVQRPNPLLRILHVERDSRELFEQDEPEVEVEAPATPNVEAAAAAPVQESQPSSAAPAPASASGPGVEAFKVEALSLLTALMAAKLEIPLPEPGATIEDLCQGNSARRNEVMADLAAEYSLAGAEGAHTAPLSDLAQRIEKALPAGWQAPGPFSRKLLESELPLSLGMRLEEATSHCKQAYGLDEGQAGAFLSLALPELRAADGPIGRNNAQDWLTSRLDAQLAARGLSRSTGGEEASGPSVSMDDVREELVGRNSPFRRAVEALARFSGLDLAEVIPASSAPSTPAANALNRVMERASRLLVPCFDERKIVEFGEPRNWLLRDMVRIAMGSDPVCPAFARRFASFEEDEHVVALDNYLKSHYGPYRDAKCKGMGSLDRRALMEELRAMAPLPGAYVLRPDPDLGVRFVLDKTGTEDFYASGETTDTSPAVRRTILITGAGPGSIGESFVREFLLQGRDVIVTTSAVSDDRTRRWRKLYSQSAANGGRLIVIPANQGLREDIDKVVDTVFQLGLIPDLCLPFGAIAQLGLTGDTDPGLTFAAHRIMLEGISELMSVLARKAQSEHLDRPLHFLLPLSPNHGQFGGDGIYAELKLGLEALLFKARTEPLLAEHVRVAGLSIGWTRGTGLMGVHDDISAGLEKSHGVRTFAPEEIVGATLEMLGRVERPFGSPTILALHGGLERVSNIGSIVAELKAGNGKTADARPAKTPRYNPLLHSWQGSNGGGATLRGSGATPARERWSKEGRNPVKIQGDKAIAIVGFGEVSPLGNAFTRWQLESTGILSLEGALELAWMMGLIRYEATAHQAGFVVADSGEPIADWEVKERFESQIISHTGIRFLEDDAFAVGPDQLPIFNSVLLEHDFDFPVTNLETAAPFLESNSEATVIEMAGETRVRLPAGSVVRVPRALKLSRYAAGQVPQGWDPERFGVPSRVAQQVDRVTLFNLVASAEAFLSAGLTPEELREYVHPAYIGNTQGSGMGGMASLASLYHCYREDRQAPGDILQETLINVMAGWLVQDYVGSFGPSVHPVGACATAAVSLGSAWDLLQVGKADFVVAGGFDDLSVEGNLGFSSMQATAATDEMLARGIGPRAMSRPNDIRRDGFVESHGGATLLLTTVERAVEMGLPIYGCLALAESHNDGLQTSIPAPGKGLLAMGARLRGRPAPLEKALDDWGLTVNDIRVLSKHDTSTAANDPNEAALLCELMEHLGRDEGNPLIVHSQKSILGHAKGGAAGWQSVAALQMMGSGIVPGNPNLDDIDPVIGDLAPLVLTDEPLRLDRIPAVMATSLGFGHVGAALLFVHPALALDLVDDDALEDYLVRLKGREPAVMQGWTGRLSGHRPTYVSRTEGPKASDLLREDQP